MARLSAHVLGTFRLELDGRRIEARDFARRSARHLVELILVRESHRVRREEIADLLWPDLDPERAAANLRKAVHFARVALARDDVLVADGSSVGLAPELDLDLDLDRLRSALAADRSRGSGPGPDERARDLLELGDRPLLPEEAYEDWVIPVRTRLLQAWSDTAGRAAEAALERADHDVARALAERMLALDHADELAHRILIRVHLAEGRVHAARRQLAACRDALVDAYGIEPDEETTALLAQPPIATPTARTEHLLVGRDAEVGAIEGVLDGLRPRGRSRGGHPRTRHPWPRVGATPSARPARLRAGRAPRRRRGADRRVA